MPKCQQAWDYGKGQAQYSEVPTALEEECFKTTVWLVVIPKPLVSALLLSVLHPCS
jgi:hypothetical protein